MIQYFLQEVYVINPYKSPSSSLAAESANGRRLAVTRLDFLVFLNVLGLLKTHF
jgi:hypothetical protein